MQVADLAWLRRAKDLMDREYAAPLHVAQVAAAAHMSEAHFARAFRREYGEAPGAYLMTRRLERAKALLRETDRPVTEICLAVGFRSLGSFSARFAQVVGMARQRPIASLWAAPSRACHRALPAPGCDRAEMEKRAW